MWMAFLMHGIHASGDLNLLRAVVSGLQCST